MTTAVTRTSSVADAVKDFPSAAPTPVLGTILVRYFAQASYLSPPLHTYVACWLVVLAGEVGGLPSLVSNSTAGAKSWTAVLVNATTAGLQEAFVGRSRLSLAPGA
ncbi:MAG: hypothetical protein ACRD0Z_10870 [Acidimicrobiales bacterium]